MVFMISLIAALDEITIDHIEKDMPTFIYFVDRLDGTTERAFNELEQAAVAVNIDLPSMPFKVGYHPDSPTEQMISSFGIRRYPQLGVFYQGVYQVYDGRLMKQQIGAFMKRQLQLRLKTVSATLADYEQFGKVIHELDPLVLFCGKRSDLEFKVFEDMAKDRKFMYYHSFDDEFCTDINLMRVDKIRDKKHLKLIDHKLTDSEKEIWIESQKKEILKQYNNRELEHHQMQDKLNSIEVPDTIQHEVMTLNQSLWNEYRVSSPSIFVVMKESKLFKMLPADKPLAELKILIEIEATVNFFNDSSKVYDYINQGKELNKDYWFALLTHNPDPTSNPLCKQIQDMADKLRFQRSTDKFACLNTTSIFKTFLEGRDLPQDYEAIFYFTYFDKATQKVLDHRRPIKHKLDTPDSLSIQSFYDSCRSSNISRYYISAADQHTSADGSMVYNISANQYMTWSLANAAIDRVIITTSNDNSMILAEISKVGMFLRPLRGQLAIARIVCSYNEVPGICDLDKTMQVFVWPAEGGQSSRPKHALNADTEVLLKSTLAKYLKSVAKLVKDEEDSKDDL